MWTQEEMAELGWAERCGKHPAQSSSGRSRLEEEEVNPSLLSPRPTPPSPAEPWLIRNHCSGPRPPG